MSNKPPASSQDLFDALERYYAGSKPDPEFAARLEHGLRSKLIEQESQKMFGKRSRITPRLAWGLGLALVAVLIGVLISSPSVVAAMKRLLGYIPGVGLVEQGAPLRVLAEPVTRSRDGITITITEAVLSGDQTVIVYKVENIPFDKLAHREDVVACPHYVDLRLSNGTQLQRISGNGTGWGSGYENRNVYPAIPAEVNEATLLVPCIQDVLPGVLPEDWELPLRFVPAPPEMTLMPVLEGMPAPVPDSTAPVEQNAIKISNIVDAGDSYILIGNFSPPAPAYAGENWSVTSSGLRLTDATGQGILFSYPDDIDLPPTTDMRSEPWAVKVPKGIAFPLTVHYGTTYLLNDPHTRYAFKFDAGPDPQPGQVWELKKEIQMGGHTFTMDSIRAQPGHEGSIGYTFEFTSVDGSVSNVNVDIEGYLPIASAGGGGGGSAGESVSFSSGLYYAQPPQGMLNIVLTNLQVYGETKEWSMEWTPGPSQSGFPSPTPVPQACLPAAALEEALANPKPLPAGLTGKLIVYGRIVEDGKDPSPENYGVYVTSPNGSGREALGQGVWPSLSPDGTKAAYAWDGGLYVADLIGRQKYHIPGTSQNDYSPIWSPDGNRLAFVRIDDFNLYIINPDGSGLQKATDGIEYELLVGWSPDGSSLYYGIPVQNGHQIRKVDLASGAVQDLFSVISKGVSIAISPDGTRFATVERLADNPLFGLFLSRMDSTDRQLLVEVDRWSISDPVWSPDGKFLLFTLTNYDTTDVEEIPAVFDLQACQIFPLSIRGSVKGWSP